MCPLLQKQRTVCYKSFFDGFEWISCVCVLTGCERTLWSFHLTLLYNAFVHTHSLFKSFNFNDVIFMQQWFFNNYWKLRATCRVVSFSCNGARCNNFLNTYISLVRCRRLKWSFFMKVTLNLCKANDIINSINLINISYSKWVVRSIVYLRQFGQNDRSVMHHLLIHNYEQEINERKIYQIINIRYNSESLHCTSHLIRFI